MHDYHNNPLKIKEKTRLQFYSILNRFYLSSQICYTLLMR
jgi:hypothetical protein